MLRPLHFMRAGRDGFRRLAAAGRRLFPMLALLAIVVGYGWVQGRGFTPGAIEDDSEGYFILGKRLAAGEPAGRVEDDPFVYQSHVWVRNGRGELLPKYAPGYPLLVGLAARFGGDRAAFAVAPACGGLALVGAWLLFGRWMRPGPALLATLVLAVNRAFLDYASYPLSHVPEMAFLLWGAWALWSWLRHPDSWTYAALAGLLLGSAVAIRHTAILQAPAVGIALWLGLAADRTRWRPRAWRALLLCVAFGVGPALVAGYQTRWFGNPFLSGYALSGEQNAFQWAYAAANFAKLNHGLATELALFVAVPGLLGLLAAGPAAERWMRALMVLGPYLVYGTYYWSPPNMAYYRFLLPAVPLLIGGAFLLLDGIPSRGGRWLAMACTTLVCVGQAWPRWAEGLSPRPLLGSRGANHAAAAKAIAPHLAEDAVLLLMPPLDRGMGAFRRYRPYAWGAFDARRIATEMPPWNPPATSTEGRRRGSASMEDWPIRVQEERRAELQRLYDELGSAGLARRRAELVAEWLAKGREVAVLSPAWRVAQTQAALRSSAAAWSAATVFDTPSAGQWTLLKAQATSRGSSRN